MVWVFFCFLSIHSCEAGVVAHDVALGIIPILVSKVQYLRLTTGCGDSVYPLGHILGNWKFFEFSMCYHSGSI